MLPSKNRLHFQKDFKKIFASGKKYPREFFLIRALLNNLNRPRFSIVIGKSIIKKAAKRNSIKRLLSSIIEEKLARIKKGIDVVIVLKKPLFLKPNREAKKELRLCLKKEIEDIFKKIKLF